MEIEIRMPVFTFEFFAFNKESIFPVRGSYMSFQQVKEILEQTKTGGQRKPITVNIEETVRVLLLWRDPPHPT